MSGLELRWALGWTLLRFLWVGGGIWVAAAIARRLLRDASPHPISGTVLDAAGDGEHAAILTIEGLPHAQVIDEAGNVLRARVITVDNTEPVPTRLGAVEVDETEPRRVRLGAVGYVEQDAPRASIDVDQTVPMASAVIRTAAPRARRAAIEFVVPAAEAKSGACPLCGHALGAAPDGSL